MDGAEFRRRRTDAGYNKRRFVAGDIGVDIDTVKDWELGRRKVPRYAEKWLEKIEAEIKAAKKKKGRI